MKFAGIVLLVASAAAESVKDWGTCLPTQTCLTATFKCCNLIAESWAAISATAPTNSIKGLMICADTASTTYGVIPASAD